MMKSNFLPKNLLPLDLLLGHSQWWVIINQNIYLMIIFWSSHSGKIICISLISKKIITIHSLLLIIKGRFPLFFLLLNVDHWLSYEDFSLYDEIYQHSRKPICIYVRGSTMKAIKIMRQIVRYNRARKEAWAQNRSILWPKNRSKWGFSTML